MYLNPTRQSGLTIIEALVALVVISVGLLGIAGLQLVSMKQNSSALQHSHAVWAGYSMADRIRSNNVSFADYPGIDTDSAYSQDCRSGPCSNTELVIGDANRLVVTVMWDDEGTGATGTDCSGDAQVDLTCYSVTLIQ